VRHPLQQRGRLLHVLAHDGGPALLDSNKCCLQPLAGVSQAANLLPLMLPLLPLLLPLLPLLLPLLLHLLRLRPLSGDACVVQRFTGAEDLVVTNDYRCISCP
jgi:hypothetical protein